MGVVALAGCQSVDWPWAKSSPPSGPGGAAEPSAAASSSAYPNLHTVPPRPQLSYSVQQRRAIVDGLVADREMARYTDQVVRYRTGQSSLPPPPAPPTVVANAVPGGLIAPIEPQGEATAPAAPAGPSDYGGRDVFNQQFEDDTLGDFVDQLDQGTDAETPPTSEAPADAGAAADTAPAPAESGDKASGFFGWLGGLFGKAEAKPAAPAAAPEADPPMAPAPGAARPPEPPDRLSDADSGAETAIAAAWIDPAASLPSASGNVDRRAPASGAALAEGQGSGPVPVPEPRPSAEMPERQARDVTAIAVGAEGVAIGEERAADRDRRAMPASSPESPSSILVLFEPGSASLPPGASARLERILATAKAHGAVIRIEGEAAGAPALALDRARAVALGLMRLGASARELEMTLAPAASADQARLVLAGPAAR